jgi:hypothetical protein
VQLSLTDQAIFRRKRRELSRRRAAYDGVKYDDRMSSDPVVVRRVCEELGVPFRDFSLVEKRRAAYEQDAASDQAIRRAFEDDADLQLHGDRVPEECDGH